jgi:hypothetical protein
LFPLFKSFHLLIRNSFYYFLDLIYKKVQIYQWYLIINPVCFSFMHRFNDFNISLFFSFTLIFSQLYQIAIFKYSTDPIIFIVVFQYAMAFKDTISKLSNINIAIFKHFFAHSMQLSIDIISPLCQSQLKIILIAMGIDIVTTMSAFKNIWKS